MQVKELIGKHAFALKSWLNSSKTQSWIVLIAVLAIGSLAALSPLSLVLPRKQSEQTQTFECLSEDSIQVPEAKAIASQDYSALIKSAPYVFYPQESGRLSFVDLQFERVVRSKNSVSLQGRCATVTFSVVATSKQSNKLRISAGKLEILRGDKSGSECDISGFVYEDDAAKRYSCKETYRYKCVDSSTGEPKLWLNFATLEIELDGQLELARNGQFSKPRSEFGCVFKADK